MNIFSVFQIQSNDLQLWLQLLEAGTANLFVAVIDNVVSLSAEDASGLIFSENDSIFSSEDLKGIFNIYVKGSADLNGQNNSSKLVNFADYSGGFHIKLLLWGGNLFVT